MDMKEKSPWRDDADADADAGAGCYIYTSMFF